MASASAISPSLPSASIRRIPADQSKFFFIAKYDWRAAVPAAEHHSSALLKAKCNLKVLLAMLGRAKEGLKKVIFVYTGWLQRRPLVTRAITTSLIISCSDLVAQLIGFRNTPHLDWKRTLRAGVLGLLYTGPILFMWFNKLLPRILGQGVFSTLSKLQKAALGMVIDQTCFGWFTVGGYLFWVNFLEHFSYERAARNVRHNILKTITASWTFWPMIMFGNLRFTPIEFQVLVVNFASVFWNLYLSVRNQKGQLEMRQNRLD